MTPWTIYTQIEPLELDEILYDSELSSTRPIRGVARSVGGLVVEGSSALVFKGFDLGVSTVQTLELELGVDRMARIQDKTIQLWHEGSVQGSNLADPLSENLKVYRWENLDLEWTVDSGVVIDLQPHTQYPSSSTVRIRSVRLRAV